MPEFVIVIAAAAVAAIGIVIGFVARSLVASSSVKHAEQYGQRLVAEARAKQKEIVLEGKDEALHLRRAAEEEAREQRATLQRPSAVCWTGRRRSIARPRASTDGRPSCRGGATELDGERSRLGELQQRQLFELERV